MVTLTFFSCSKYDPSKTYSVNDLSFNEIQNKYFFEDFLKTFPFNGSIYIEDSTYISYGNILDGYKSGIFKTYLKDNKTLILKENYVNGLLEGPKVTYNLKGEITQKENFQRGIKNGPQRINCTQSQKCTDSTTAYFPYTHYYEYFKNGELNGFKEFFSEKRKTFEIYYKDGLRIGPYKKYDSYGNLSYEYSEVRDDLCTGNFKSYSSNGQITANGFMTLGNCGYTTYYSSIIDERKRGNWTFWYDNGNKQSEGSFTYEFFNEEKYKNFDLPGSKVGRWFEWDIDGKLKYDQNYRGGFERGEQIFYLNGIKASKHYAVLIVFGDEIKSVIAGSFKIYDLENGKIKSESFYGTPYEIYGDNSSDDFFKVENCPDNETSCLKGISYTYWPDGSIRSRCEYKNGLLHGECNRYSKFDGFNYKNEGYKNGVKVY
tara:strand:+ start:106 stop:1395 length:1290 start_codon:yes stop_codon:yes gene_type:complete